MANLRSDLPSLLREAGLNVVVVKGWRLRHRPGSFAPVGVLNHHTGSSAKGWTQAKELTYAKWMFLTGRSDLPAPLVQMSLGRSGTVYIGAAGRSNHAGKAKPSGSVAGGDGNTLYVGIEWMLSGSEPIPATMMKAGVTLNAVLTKRVTKTSVETISCHYQTSVTGKWDIGDPNGIDFHGRKVLDVDKFREAVRHERHRLFAASTGSAPVPVPASLVADSTSPTGVAWKPEVQTVFSVATNNIMSLPPNPHPRATLRVAPEASVMMVQEADLPEVHRILRSNSLSRLTAAVPKGNGYAAFVLYDPTLWAHVSTEFFLAYKGAAHVSLTRHIAVTVLRNRVLDKEVAFISYHAVTAGADRIRALLRREGDAAVRRQVKRFRDKGTPVIVGADLNRTTKVFLSASSHARHKIDHVLGWDSPTTDLRLDAHHAVNTASDHDTLVARFTATTK